MVERVVLRGGRRRGHRPSWGDVGKQSQLEFVERLKFVIIVPIFQEKRPFPVKTLRLTRAIVHCINLHSAFWILSFFGQRGGVGSIVTLSPTLSTHHQFMELISRKRRSKSKLSLRAFGIPTMRANSEQSDNAWWTKSYFKTGVRYINHWHTLWWKQILC